MGNTETRVTKVRRELTKSEFYKETKRAIPIAEETMTSYIIKRPVGDCEYMAVPKAVVERTRYYDDGNSDVAWLFHHAGMLSPELEDELNIGTSGKAVRFHVGRIVELPVVRRSIEKKDDGEKVLWADAEIVREVFVPDRNGNILAGYKEIESRQVYFNAEGRETGYCSDHLGHGPQTVDKLDVIAEFVYQLETAQHDMKISRLKDGIYFQMEIDQCCMGFRRGLDDVILGYEDEATAAKEQVIHLRGLIQKMWDSYWQLDESSTLSTDVSPSSENLPETKCLGKITDAEGKGYHTTPLSPSELPKGLETTLGLKIQQDHKDALEAAKQRALREEELKQCQIAEERERRRKAAEYNTLNDKPATFWARLFCRS